MRIRRSCLILMTNKLFFLRHKSCIGFITFRTKGSHFRLSFVTTLKVNFVMVNFLVLKKCKNANTERFFTCLVLVFIYEIKQVRIELRLVLLGKRIYILGRHVCFSVAQNLLYLSWLVQLWFLMKKPVISTTIFKEKKAAHENNNNKALNIQNIYLLKFVKYGWTNYDYVSGIRPSLTGKVNVDSHFYAGQHLL